jgi:glycosyltransferase involved in cell wall biosynthesis
MKNLLFIAYYFPPMGSSGVQRPFKLIKYLPERGWHPIVLVPEPGMYHQFDASLQEEAEDMALTIYRVKGKTPFHVLGGGQKHVPTLPNPLAKVLRYLSAWSYLPDNKRGWIKPAMELVPEIISQHKPELIVATSPPASNLILAAEISRQYQIPCVFDMRDDWVDDHQKIYPTRWHRKKMQSLETQTLEQASAVISVNEVISQALQQRNDHLKIPFVALPSGFDPVDFEKSKASASLKPTADTITLLYSGRLYGENQPDAFLEALVLLVKEQPELKKTLRLAFQGGLEPQHLGLISSLGLSDMIIDLGYVDHATAIANLKVADALWLMAAHTYRGNQVSTGKIIEYMAAEKPIFALAVENGALHELLKPYGAYLMADPFSVAKIKAQLTIFLDYLFRSIPQKVNTEYVQTLNVRSMAERCSAIFKDVLSSR